MTDTPFHALALQFACDGVNGCANREAARALMESSLARLKKAILGSKAFIGADLKLVVLPEYFLTGYPMRETPEEWIDKACLEPGDPVFDTLADIAQGAGVFLAGNSYETDNQFPGLYFQASYVFSPTGDKVLSYRRLNSLYSPTPHDVWDKYLDLYGLEAVFPVAQTDIGRLAAIASEEILYPEIARAHGLKGAEIFVHSSSEIGGPVLTPKMIAKRARAIENMAYVVSANTGGIRQTALPEACADGNSQIVDYRGTVLAESGDGDTMTAFAEVDLGALRRWRRRPGMSNFLSRQRLELFRETYAQASPQPANALLDDSKAVRPLVKEHFRTNQEKIIDRLSKAGII